MIEKQEGLELILSFCKQGFDPINPNKGCLEVLAKNWEEAKPIFFEQAKIDTYNAENILRALKKEFNIGFSEQEIRELYDEMIGKRLGKVIPFSEKLGVKLTNEQRIRFWEQLFSGKWNKYEVQDAEKKLGKLELTQHQLNAICNEYLKVLTGKKEEKFKVEDLQYLLTNRTELKPDWDQELAQSAFNHRAYERKLLDNPYSKEDFSLLKKIGAKVDEEKTRVFYRKKLSEKPNYEYKKDDHARQIKESLERILKVSGVSLEDRENQELQNFYRNHLGAQSVSTIKQVEALTKIPLASETIQQVYSDKLHQGYTGEIVQLKTSLHVEPDFDDATVQNAYTNLFEQGIYGAFDRALRVYLFTDVKPDGKRKKMKSAVKKGLRKVRSHISSLLPTQIDDIEFQTLSWLSEHYPKECYNYFKGQVKDLIKNQSFCEVDQFLTNMRMEPYPEEAYVLACRKGDWKRATSLFRENKEKIINHYPQYASLFQYFSKI